MKITTLVPAYKPKFLFDLLVALRHQTVKPDRIVFSDDSPGHAFRSALQAEPLKAATADLNIEVIDGPRSGAYANFRHLLKFWDAKTPLVHFLTDDDIIYPDFYERHIAAHAGAIANCSISRRWTALESGQPVGQLPVPEHVAFGTTISRCNNWFGELSNAVFSAELCEVIDKACLADIPFSGLEDIGIFLSASLRKPVCFLNEPLGFFRMNSGQNTQQLQSRQMKLAHLAWFALAFAGRRIGQLQPAQVVECASRMGMLVMNRYAQDADMASFCEVIPGLIRGDAAAEDQFLDAWSDYLAPR